MRRPNILFVTTDQQCASGLGIFDRRYITPNLDKLANTGVAFTRSYSCSPLCTPARASWITGQYPVKHGAWTVGTMLDPNSVTLPALLHGAGYRSAIIGKSHFEPGEGGGRTESLPHSHDTARFRQWSGPWYGFDYAQINVGHVDEKHSASMHYRAWLEEQGVSIGDFFGHGRPSQRREPSAWDLPEKFHACKWAADRAIDFVEQHQKTSAADPFFLMLNFPEPHSPFRVPEPWYSRSSSLNVGQPIRRWNEWSDKPDFYRAVIQGTQNELKWHDRYGIACLWPERLPLTEAQAGHYTEREAGFVRAYVAMVALLDHHLGRVLSALDSLRLSENTLIVFTSDHGEMLGDHFMWGKGPLHYDGCLRVPTVVRWPGQTPAGRRSDALFSTVDFAPTFLEAAGLPVHPEMQGRSQLTALRDPERRVRRGVWVDHRAERGLYVNSWITERHRLSIHSREDGRQEFELYDLVNDPHEFTNLARSGQHWELVAELSAALLQERSETARAWQPRVSYA